MLTKTKDTQIMYMYTYHNQQELGYEAKPVSVISLKENKITFIKSNLLIHWPYCSHIITSDLPDVIDLWQA